MSARRRKCAEDPREPETAPKLRPFWEPDGDPGTVAYFRAAGLAYATCSLLRVPDARLGVAQTVPSEFSPAGLRAPAA